MGSDSECQTPLLNLAAAIARQTEQQALNEFSVPLKPLLGFDGMIRNGFQRGILFSIEDYLELMDYSGRISRSDKRGCIDENALPILERLNLDPERWSQRRITITPKYTHQKRKHQLYATDTVGFRLEGQPLAPIV